MKLRYKWWAFLIIILSPGSIIFLATAGVLLYLAIAIFKDSVSNILAVLASISTALAGFFIKDDWDKVQKNTLLEKKGRSAIRNINSIGFQIYQIRQWIKIFITQEKITKKELDEINRHLETTEVNIKSSLADWTDVIPELQEQEEVLKNYQDIIKNYVEEIFKNKKKMLEVGENEELKKGLERKIKGIEKEMKELKRYGPFDRAVMLGEVENNPSIYSSNLGYNFVEKICSNCGKTYNDNSFVPSFVNLNNLCPECSMSRFGFK